METISAAPSAPEWHKRVVPVVHILLCIVLVAVLSYAAIGKITAYEPTPSGWETGIHALASMLSAQKVIPPSLTLSAAYGVVVAECACVVLLFPIRTRRFAFAIATAMLLIFSAYMIHLILRDGFATCGCFGKLRSLDAWELGWRNGGLFALVSAAWATLPRDDSSAPRASSD